MGNGNWEMGTGYWEMGIRKWRLENENFVFTSNF